jgi:Subtilase family
MRKTSLSLRHRVRVTALTAALFTLAAFGFSQPGLSSVYTDEGSSSGGGGGSGTSGSGGGGGSWDSGSWSSGSSGSGGSGSGSGAGSGSGDTLSGSGSSNTGSGSSNSGSGSSNSGSGSSNSGSGSSNSGSGSSNSGRDSSSFEDIRAWQGLAARENPDFDSRGFPTRRGELISLDLSKEQIKAAKQRGFRVIDTVKLPALDMLMVRLRAPDGMSAADAIKLLRASDPDTFYELDHYFGVTSGGIDKAAAGMVEMKVPKPQPLWIGMIDTAVWTQATLRGVRVEAQNFIGSKSRSGRPPFAHGTAVASILARQGAVRLTSANIFSADARPFSSAEAIARAVNWMVARKVPVINISVAGPRNALVDRVIAAAVARGHAVVAAAGNGGPAAPPAYPAASPGAVAVTAIDRTGLVYLNANRGNYIEISAIGVGIGAEAPDGTMRPHSGTSFAAPFVSAYLARCMKGIAPQSRLACIRQMETRARDLGVPGRDPVYGYGLLVP